MRYAIVIKSCALATLALLALPQAQAQALNRPGGLLNRVRRPAAQPAEAPAAPAANDAEVSVKGSALLKFDQTPLEMVLKAYGELVGKTVLKDPATTCQPITLRQLESQELSEEEKVEAIETVLEMNGVHIEPYREKFVRALPRKEVRKEGIPLMDPDAELNDSTRVVSFRLTFKNISVEEAQKAIEGFKSASGVLNVFERTNTILVTDMEANINRMREIAHSIDIPTPVTENVFVRQIKNASAQEIKTALEAIVQESQKELEKNGKQPSALANQPQPSMLSPASRLLGRPGQPQPQQPVNNPTLVTQVSDADRGMIRGKVLILADERSNKLIIVTAKPNMDFFDKVIEQLDVETTPDIVVKVYRLKYAEAEDVSDMINDLIGNSSASKSNSKGNQNPTARQGTSANMTRPGMAQQKKSVNQRSGEPKAGELSKDNTTVLADKRINGLVVMTNKELVPTVEQIIESMDIKLSQVLIETCIIEVQLGNDISTGMDWVQKGRRNVMVDHSVANGFSDNRYYAQDSNGNIMKYSYTQQEFDNLSEDTKDRLGIDSLSEVFSKSARLARDGFLNYASGGAYGLAGGAQGGQEAFGLASGVASNLLNKSFSFVFDSDKLGLSAILHASQTDSRTKYIASPVIMTLDNKEAVINATAMHYLLKGFTSSGNSYSTIAVPDYEQKELGIEIKVTPKINPNGTVMLTVEEKYTQLGAKEPIQYSSGNSSSGGVGGLQTVQVPTTITREMSSDVLLEDNQTVVFAGLTDKTVAESETGIPFLKDIPWIGKWLFSSVEKSETRTELLVFMTPYVLNDAEAAQAEALRRKKTMPDPHPWDDDGWSSSPLADGVSYKEQMRRLKDEAKKQDEERKTKIAIEKWKVERAKKLKELSKEERDLWLKMHKEELEKEDKEKLEEMMLDKDSQDGLRSLAEEIRARKLKEAEGEIEAGAAQVELGNERAKLDAAKKAAAEVEAEKKEAK